MDNALDIEVLGEIPNNFRRRIDLYNRTISLENGSIYKRVKENKVNPNADGAIEKNPHDHKYGRKIKSISDGPEGKRPFSGTRAYVLVSGSAIPKNPKFADKEEDSVLMTFLEQSARIASDTAMDLISQKASMMTSSLNLMVNQAKADLWKAGNKKLQWVAEGWRGGMQWIDDGINSLMDTVARNTVDSDWYKRELGINHNDYPAVKALVGGDDWYNKKLKEGLAKGDAAAIAEYTKIIDSILKGLKDRDFEREAESSEDYGTKDESRMIVSDKERVASFGDTDESRNTSPDPSMKTAFEEKDDPTLAVKPDAVIKKLFDDKTDSKDIAADKSLVAKYAKKSSDSRNPAASGSYSDVTADSSRVVQAVDSFKKALEAGVAKVFTAQVKAGLKDLISKSRDLGEANRDAFEASYSYLIEPLEEITRAKYEDYVKFEKLLGGEESSSVSDPTITKPDFEPVSTTDDTGTTNVSGLDTASSTTDPDTVNSGTMDSVGSANDTGTVNTAELNSGVSKDMTETVVDSLDWKSKLELEDHKFYDPADSVEVMTIGENGEPDITKMSTAEIAKMEKRQNRINSIIRYLIDLEENHSVEEDSSQAANSVHTLDDSKKEVTDEALLALMRGERDNIYDKSLIFLERAYSGSQISDDDIISLMDANEAGFDVLNTAANLFARTTLGQQTLSAISEYTSTSALSKMYYAGVSKLTGKLWGKDTVEYNEPDPLTSVESNSTMGASSDLSSLANTNIKQALAGAASSLLDKAKAAVTGSSDSSQYNLYQWFTHDGNVCKYCLAPSEQFMLMIDKFSSISLADIDLKKEKEVGKEDTSLNGEYSYFDAMNSKNGDTTDLSVTENSEYGIADLATNFRVNKTFIGGEIEYFKSGYYHFFFVKPDLNLTENHIHVMECGGYPRLCDVIPELSYDLKGLEQTWTDGLFPPSISMIRRENAHPFFSYLLSNAIKSLNIPDYALESKEGFENMFGHRFSFGTTGRKSGYQTDFSINFYDTNDLLILNTIKTWVKYIEVMYEGQANLMVNPMQTGNMDYLGALYYFILEPDNQTIAHWGRYTGIYPVNVPWSTISMNPGSSDIPEFSVNFKCQWHEWNSLEVLQDFNFVMRGAGMYGGADANNSAMTYFKLGSICKRESQTITADPNLIAGATVSENRALVEFIDLKNAEKVSASPMLRPYKYVLTFDSARDFSTFNGENGLRSPIESNAYNMFINPPTNGYTITSGVGGQVAAAAAAAASAASYGRRR